jgi:hypothetical protein
MIQSAKILGSVLFYRPLYKQIYSTQTRINYTNIAPIKTDKRTVQSSYPFGYEVDKSLVVWGTNLESTVGEKFTREQLAMVQLAPYQNSVIVGLVLSDGWLRFASVRSKNALLGFKQAADRASYVWFVFNLLSHYCGNSPRGTTGVRAGNIFYGLEFFTRSMPCITELHSLFYTNGVKRVPQNVYDLLTPVALAHVIMGDGSVQRYGILLCTDSYTVKDVVRLLNVLVVKFRIECTIRAHKKDQYRIYILGRSMPLLRDIVKPHMCPSMIYKLNLDRITRKKH